MGTICWTVFHHGDAPHLHHAHHIAHSVGHFARPIVHHGGTLPRHIPSAAARLRAWIEVVCKVIPAVVAGGGLLVPHPANLPPSPERPPFITPAPALPSPWIPGGSIVPTGIPGASRAGVIPSQENIPEPSTAGLLLGGAVGLALVRIIIREQPGLTGGAQPSSGQAKLFGIGPIA